MSDDGSVIRYEVVKAADDEWFFRIVAANGETLAHSENYRHRSDADHAITLIRIGGGEISEVAP